MCSHSKGDLMTVRIKKERFIPFLAILFLLFVGLILIMIHGCSKEAGGPELFGYSEEQIDDSEC